MATYKVNVNKLNLRSSPVKDFADKSNVMGVLLKDAIFKSVGVVENELGKWHVGTDGYCVSEKWLENVELIYNSYYSKKSTLTNWNENIPQLPAALRSTRGRGVKVAVLDTGLFQQHEDLADATDYFEDFTLVKDNTDYDGHGTHVSGIIAARSHAKNGLIGTAPDCELIVLKVLPDEKDVNSPDNYNNINDALNAAINQGADVINMSFSLNTESADASAEWQKSLQQLKNKIKEITASNIIVVAAAGDKADLKEGNLFFPASEEGVISVATVSRGYFERNPIVNPNLNIVSPFTNYVSTYTSPSCYESLWGCSMSCAFISGIVALLISKNRIDANQRFSKSEILSMLSEYDLPLDKMNYEDANNFCYHLLNFPQ
jgi:subtilisin family serine protease